MASTVPFLAALSAAWAILCILSPLVDSLDNGLARRPPMGWMSWTKFLCEIDCAHHPFSCINEQLYMDHADRLAQDGYLAAGYEFVHIDDCWAEKSRDAQGRLVSDSARFPSGIRALADYMHGQGVKLGIYADYGNYTCAGYPGSFSHLRTDAETFAEWGADYLKLDGCEVDPAKWMHVGYPEMSRQLNKTGRPIVYSCSWPAYLIDKPQLVNYTVIGEWCNLWRNYDDIRASWESIMDIIAYYNANQDKLITSMSATLGLCTNGHNHPPHINPTLLDTFYKLMAAIDGKDVEELRKFSTSHFKVQGLMGKTAESDVLHLVYAVISPEVDEEAFRAMPIKPFQESPAVGRKRKRAATARHQPSPVSGLVQLHVSSAPGSAVVRTSTGMFTFDGTAEDLDAKQAEFNVRVEEERARLRREGGTLKRTK